MAREKTDIAEDILVGIACGDALGKMASKRSAEQVIDIYGSRLTTIAKPIITHRSKKNDWEKGDITDETILTLLIADSIIAQGRFDREDIGKRMIACTDFRGGSQILKLKATNDPNSFAIDGDTNGACIRVAGISIAYNNDTRLNQYLIDSSNLTHAGKEAILGGVLMGDIYAGIIKGKNARELSQETLPRFKEIRQEYFPSIKSSKIEENLGLGFNLSERLYGNNLCDALENKLKLTAYPHSSVVAAIIMGLNYINPRNCMVDIVNRQNSGGDLDSVASIAGGICCGLNGHSLINDWKEAVEKQNNFSLRDYAIKLLQVNNGQSYSL